MGRRNQLGTSGLEGNTVVLEAEGNSTFSGGVKSTLSCGVCTSTLWNGNSGLGVIEPAV